MKLCAGVKNRAIQARGRSHKRISAATYGLGLLGVFGHAAQKAAVCLVTPVKKPARTRHAWLGETAGSLAG
jgi:hypothetical protein